MLRSKIAGSPEIELVRCRCTVRRTVLLRYGMSSPQKDAAAEPLLADQLLYGGRPSALRYTLAYMNGNYKRSTNVKHGSAFVFLPLRNVPSRMLEVLEPACTRHASFAPKYSSWTSHPPSLPPTMPFLLFIFAVNRLRCGRVMPIGKRCGKNGMIRSENMVGPGQLQDLGGKIVFLPFVMSPTRYCTRTTPCANTS